MKYKNPLPTVDSIISKQNKIVLIRRGNRPFRGKLALPGGYIDHFETAEHAAVREAKEETGLQIKLNCILGVYSEPKRDPDKHTMSTVFIAKSFSGKLKGGDDATEAGWFDLKKLKPSELAFDHFKIIRDFIKWKKNNETYWSTK